MSWVETLRDDPVMAALIEKHGEITHEPAANEFERLCVSIINQQLSTASANAVRDRTFALFDGSITPEAMSSISDADLRDAGLSDRKVQYLNNVADAYLDDEIGRDQFIDQSDQAVIEELTTIKGIGEWTAHMYLMFVLGREDVLPLGDLGIRNGIEEIYGDGTDLSRPEMREIAEQWRPYRTYAMRYIWREYETD